MGTLNSRFQGWTLLVASVCVTIIVAGLALGQEQPPQPNPPAPGGMMMPGMQGPGMMRGMAGRGMMQRQRMMPGMGRPARMPRMARMGGGEPQLEGLLRRPEIRKELGITPEQLQKLEDVRFNAQKESIQHRSALQISRLELQRLMSAENPDRAAIDKKIQETSQEEAALMRSSINARLNARGVLTAEQRTKLKEIMQNRMRPEGQQAAPAGRPGRPGRKAAPAGAPAPAPPAKPSEN